MTNKRRHPRLKHSAKIRVVTSVGEEFIVDMLDFSESGLYLKSSNEIALEVGDMLEVNTLEFESAPVQKVTVVRKESGTGFAIEFVGV